MSEHYYSKRPHSKSNRHTFSEVLLGEKFSFTSDAGVFSKGGIDFGSRLLIESFVAPEITGDVLDVGCGYGPIGIAIAHSNDDRSVWMVDINERAITLATENAATNSVQNVRVVQSDRLSAVEDHTFAAVVTNPPIRAGKNVVHNIFEKSADVLSSQGELWVVIQKKQGAPSAEKKLRSLFETVEVVSRKKGYFIFKAVKA